MEEIIVIHAAGNARIHAVRTVVPRGDDGLHLGDQGQSSLLDHFDADLRLITFGFTLLDIESRTCGVIALRGEHQTELVFTCGSRSDGVSDGEEEFILTVQRGIGRAGIFKEDLFNAIALRDLGGAERFFIHRDRIDLEDACVVLRNKEDGIEAVVVRDLISDGHGVAHVTVIHVKGCVAVHVRGELDVFAVCVEGIAVSDHVGGELVGAEGDLAVSHGALQGFRHAIMHAHDTIGTGATEGLREVRGDIHGHFKSGSRFGDLGRSDLIRIFRLVHNLLKEGQVKVSALLCA